MNKNDRIYSASVQRLRDPERLQVLEVEKVVTHALTGIQAHSVLDVGVGSGIFAEAFAKRGLSVAGVDLNPEMLAATKTYLPQARLEKAHAEELPFEKNSYDLVFMGHVLHETDDGVAALMEARRVSVLRTVVLEWAKKDQPFGPPMQHRLSQQDVRNWAEMAGFTRFHHQPLTYMDLYILEK